MKQKTILIITLILFVLGMLFLMSGCSECNEWKVISRYKEIERRQDSIITLLNTEPDTVYETVAIVSYAFDTVFFDKLDSLWQEILINRQYQNAMINSMFTLGQGITAADSNNRMGYFALKENQQQFLHNDSIFTERMFLMESGIYKIQTAIDSQRLRCWLDCKNNFIVTDSTNCNEVLEILNNLNQ